MRELTLIGLDVDGKHIICEGGDPADKFLVRVDDRLRAAVRGDRTWLGQTARDNEVKGVLRPKDIQARIRAGASVEEVAGAAGVDVSKVERFAHPVLLERQRAAELATAAHPVLADGPAPETLLETISSSLAERGLTAESTDWDAWRTDDGRWTVRMCWKAGLSENFAHFRFTPGAHGGTITAIDESISSLADSSMAVMVPPCAPGVNRKCAKFSDRPTFQHIRTVQRPSSVRQASQSVDSAVKPRSASDELIVSSSVSGAGPSASTGWAAVANSAAR